MYIDFNPYNNRAGHFDRFFNDFFRPVNGVAKKTVFPALNISSDDNSFFVRAELPGLGIEDVEVTITDDRLDLKGERKYEEGVFLHRERTAGVFHRSLALNVPIDRNKVSASMKDGVLEIVLPKAEEAQPKKINIEIA